MASAGLINGAPTDTNNENKEDPLITDPDPHEVEPLDCTAREGLGFSATGSITLATNSKVSYLGAPA
jgi:hypothetical protein